MNSALDALREVLADGEAWLVGGAVRDSLLGRESSDYDLIVPGDPAPVARAIAKAGGRAACFSLSKEFGAWRVVARDGSWQIDVETLRAETLEQDLRLRDFTVNAIARPVRGGELIDPLGGRGDLQARRLRMASPRAFEDDPLRALRLVRIFAELGFEPDELAREQARRAAPALARVSGERMLVELRRILASARARAGIELMSALGIGEVVLPELERLRGVEQSHFHHADVYGHTLEVLDRAVELTSSTHVEAWETLGEAGARARDLLAEPLADEMTRGEALRWGALLHDATKPMTREVRADGRVTFMGHDESGAELARAVLTRLRASERLRAHVAALVRHHLRLGFLVHEPQPLSRRAVYRYLRRCAPVGVDVTALSVADRLATRGKDSERAIAAHLELAARMLEDAVRWDRDGPPAPLVRGDELARTLGIEAGPLVGELLDQIAEASFAGEAGDEQQALELARRTLDARSVP